MNWKLILLLSLLGLAHAVVFVGGLPDQVSALSWPVVWGICAVVISRRAPGHHFWHGFGVGLLNWFWVTVTHVVLFETYVAHHPGETAARWTKALPALPVIGSIAATLRHYDSPIPGASAVIIGLLAWLTSRFLKPRRS